MVFFIGKDLLFLSKVQQAARAAGVRLQTCSSLTQAMALLAKSSESASASETGDAMEGVVLDLSVPFDTASLQQLLEAAAADSQRPMATVAYGPHVNVDALEAARQAGFQSVMTQGQFDRSVVGWFQQLAASR